ncbi:MAG: bifunctional glycosyltransferase/class I SAM-dependent methyltransferase [Candidatus Sumerlaeia bacterium]|nr:bifunctional glycosyltransferase/class I SAM-dependent methyltransferase [Candidatus Sumerlaeia bacterium]
MAIVNKLSILIPVYNEIRTLETILDRVLAAPLPCERELVIVDDGSKDGSREVLTRYAEKYPETVRIHFHKKNGGKGKAIRTAISMMTGDWAIIQDADLEYDPNEYENLLLPVQEGVADAVFGSRFIQGKYRRAMFFWHTMANKILTLTSNILNDLNLTDMETCYKLVRADILKNLNIRSSGFDLEPELTAKLARWGARIYEVPISYRGRSYAEGKKIGLKDAFHAMSAMVRYRYFDTNYAKHDGFLILQAVRKAKGFNKWMYSQFKEYVGAEVFEAGCGIGNITELLLDRRRLVVADYEDFYVDRITQSYGHLLNFKSYKADLTHPDDIAAVGEGGQFDTIICLNVMEHIEDHEIVLKHFHQLLKPGGHCIILVPHDPKLYTAVDKTLGHFRRYKKTELRALMEDAGYTDVKTKGFNRVGGLGWWFSGNILRKKTLTPGQMGTFEMLLPLVKIAEQFPFHAHNSVVGIGRKP